MKAAFKAGKQNFEIRDVPVPAIGPDDCLVRVHYCGICAWCYEEWLRDGTNDIYGAGVTGHEQTGIIEQVGANVTAWKPGDRVLNYAVKFCGVCPECLAGKETYCRHGVSSIIGGYAEYYAAPARALLPAPEAIDLKHASLIGDMVGTTMHAIRRAFSVNLPRTTAAVWGLGPVGLFAVQGLRSFPGVQRIIALDPVELRRRTALEVGADEALDTSLPETEQKLLQENEGRGIDYAFNCAIRKPQALETAFRTLRLDGYLMNITGQALSGFQTEKRVDGSFYFQKNEYEENVALVQSGAIRLEPILTHEFPLDRINEAMELRVTQPEKALKIAIRCV